MPVQPLKMRSIVVTERPIVIELKPVQLRNASYPILLTLSGMIMDSNPVQPAKAWCSITLTLSGIVISFNPVQWENAPIPMASTVLGMVIEVRVVQPSKAPNPMRVMLFGMVVVLQPATNSFVALLMMALQLPRLSKTGFCGFTVMVVRLGQLDNALYPILVMFLGILMEARFVQPLKAYSPMLVA